MLKLNTWNYFQMQKAGSLQAYPSYLSCEGQETRHGDKLVENEVELLELRVRVQSEKFIVHHNSVESVTDHLHLPCSVREESCETTAKTYVWTNKDTPCKLHRIRSISPSTVRSTWLVDHRSKLMLNVTDSFEAPGCGLEVKTTQLDDVYVVEMVTESVIDKVHQMPQLNIREMDMQQNTALALDYLSYQLQRQIEEAQLVAGAQICKQQQEVWDSTPIQIRPGLFTSTHGDMVYQFSCPNKTARILELEDCWNDIPIQDGGFVIPHNKLFTPHSSKVACSHFFPLKGLSTGKPNCNF